MKLKMAKTTTKLASYFIVVLLCAASLVAFSQFRIRCELGEAAELLQASSRGGHSHSDHHHSGNAQVASDDQQRSVEGRTHSHEHSHSAVTPHSQSEYGHSHADSSHQGQGPISKVAHGKKDPKKDDDACCSNTGFAEFNVGKSSAHFSPAFVTALIRYVVAALDLVDVSLDFRSELFAKLNAPPPISPHIPTTILRI